MSFSGGLPPPFAHTCRHGKPHPSSTLRAIARRHGGGCRGTRRRPSTRRAVARRHGVVLGLCPLASSLSFPVARVVVVPPRPTPRAVACEAGGGSCGVIRHPPPLLLPAVCWCLPSLVSLAPWHGTHLQTTLRAAARRRGGRRQVVPSSLSLLAISTLNPPCEQSLTAVEVGAGVLVVVPSLSLTWPLAPMIPPASSRSQRGGGC
jgi:hypothetical protein